MQFFALMIVSEALNISLFIFKKSTFGLNTTINTGVVVPSRE